jgi:flagellar biosynthesis protein FlhG
LIRDAAVPVSTGRLVDMTDPLDLWGGVTEPQTGLDGRGHAQQTQRGARVLSVGGGKGGVGKTFMTANLAVTLARMGYRVVGVDADLEGANLHTCLGVTSPTRSLADFVAQREDDLGKLLVDTPHKGVQIIAGTHANLGEAQPSHLRRVRLMRSLRQLPADFVLLDLGAGTHASVLDYFLVGDDGLLVIQPEPTSVENAYSFLRAAFYRRMRLAMVGHGVRKLVTEAMDQRNERGLRTPNDLLREIEQRDPTEGRRFVETMKSFHPRLVINEVRTAEDVKLGFAVASVCKRYFGIEAEYLGYVNHDEAARQSVIAKRPVVDFQVGSDASIYLQRIARKLVTPAGQGR